MINETNAWAIVHNAKQAGLKALQEATPNPMVVKDGSTHYIVADGFCGFAWVNVYGVRSNSKLGKELDRLGFRRNSYEKALQFWVHDGNQSMARKEAYATAMAKVLRDAGLRAYADSRMD